MVGNVRFPGTTIYTMPELWCYFQAYRGPPVGVKLTEEGQNIWGTGTLFAKNV